MLSKNRAINNIRLHNDILTKRTKILTLQKRAITVDKLVYVKNINKLQNTEEIVPFICPASQFIFLKLYFETAYIFSFSSVGSGKIKEKKLDFFPECKFLTCFEINKHVSNLYFFGLLYVAAVLIYFKKSKLYKCGFSNGKYSKQK